MARWKRCEVCGQRTPKSPCSVHTPEAPIRLDPRLHTIAKLTGGDVWSALELSWQRDLDWTIMALTIGLDLNQIEHSWRAGVRTEEGLRLVMEGVAPSWAKAFEDRGQ